MRRVLQTLMLSAFAGMMLANSLHAAEEIRWETDLPRAVELARQTNRPLLLHFWTPQCVPCRRLEHNVFNQPRVARALHTHFVPVKIDATEHPELAEKYRVNSVPRDVIVTASDQEIHRLFTPQDPDQYIAQLSAIAFRSGTKSPASTLASKAAIPNQDLIAKTEATASLPPMRRNDEQFASRIGTELPPRTGRTDFQPQATTSTDLPESHPVSVQRVEDTGEPQEVINRYASQNRAAPSPPMGDRPSMTPDGNRASMPERDQIANDTTAPAQGRSRWGGWEESAASPRDNSRAEDFAAAEGREASRMRAAEPARGPQAAVPASTPSSPDESVAAASPVDDSPSPRLSGRGSTQPPGSTVAKRSAPPIGLDGYCPVSLHRDNSWMKGNPQFGVIHRGRTYLFASEKEKQLFFADPDEYSPVLAGIDPVHLTHRGEAVEGERAHGVVYRKRIYLFSSEDNLERFWEDPERYASPIRQAMEAGDVTRLFR